jgi:hypothetical protein
MARHKHKTVTHVPSAPAASPRLLSQLLTALGELVVVAVFLLGMVTLGAWTLAGYDVYARMARPDRPPGQWIHCWRDRYAGEICRPEDRGPMRRFYARDGV